MAIIDNILVTGDFVIDHHLLKGNKSEAFSSGNIGTRYTSTYGGAKLTFNLAEHFLKNISNENENDKDKEKVTAKFFWPFTETPEQISSEGTFNDSYLQWEVSQAKNKNVRENGWNLKLYEKLGFGDLEKEKSVWYDQVPDVNSRNYKVIIIDEAGIGFRHHSNLWPDFSNAEKIILKTTYPLCEGRLWDELIKHKEKLITIVNINQIKHYNVRISNGISWEQTALDIVYGVHKDPDLKNLLKSAELIINIGSAGAVIVKTDENPGQNEYKLIFDPDNMEGEFEEKYSAEIINQVGLGCSYLAGFSAAYCIKSLNISDSVKVGLNAMNDAMMNGVYELTDTFRLKPNDLSSALYERFLNRYYSSAFIPSPAWSKGLEYIHNQEWSILENNYENRKKGYIPKANLHPLAFSLALNGINALHFAPRLSLGKALVFDRSEIENLRNLRRLIEFYDRYEDGNKPLNISVFGPPGAGKSFIIKALAKNIFSNKKTTPAFITVNLSQFRDESELPGAFHAIRDKVLEGNIPVVFWDEFDSEDYRWLKSLIAPMQDGIFQEGKETHPIGKSIFIFAGSMTYTMDHFAEEMGKAALIGKKGPDFLSRIRGYLNVFGPNRKPWFNPATTQWCSSGDPKDNCYSIRRALFISHVLRSGNNSLNIDHQLLRALIEVSFYKNGARGLDRLLTNLSVHPGRKIELSDLPSKEIIQMNVDYNDFIEKIEDDSIKAKVRNENLAASIHNSWLNFKVMDSVYFETYGDLNYDGRIDNILAAQRIGEVIAESGLFTLVTDTDLLPEAVDKVKEDFNKYIEDEDNLDKLAEKEHDEWRKVKESAGWIQGVRSDYHKIHPWLVAWSDLDKGIINRQDQEQKNKDRNTIKKYTTLLEGSGYTIVKL